MIDRFLFLSVSAFYSKRSVLGIDTLNRILELLRESYRLMLPPQMGLNVTIRLEWPTFTTLMMTMKWLWYVENVTIKIEQPLTPQY